MTNCALLHDVSMLLLAHSGLLQGASVEDCRQAYDRIAKAPENSGYSNKCLENRRLLLSSVADTLLDTASRSTYHLQQAEVEYSTLPGAIALLQV